MKIWRNPGAVGFDIALLGAWFYLYLDIKVRPYLFFDAGTVRDD
jgi:hypothetical protein